MDIDEIFLTTGACAIKWVKIGWLVDGTMERKLLYAFRGWIAFVAFMDLGTAIRSYIEKRSFLGDHSDTQFIEGKFTRLYLFLILSIEYWPAFWRLVVYMQLYITTLNSRSTPTLYLSIRFHIYEKVQYLGNYNRRVMKKLY